MVMREQRLRVELPAVLSLGSNLGDREATLRAAVAEIAALPQVTVVAASGLVETDAVKLDGVDTDAPAYLNAVVTVRTSLDPDELLSALGAIEQEHGRVRDERWGDRTLDIDIVDFGGLRVDTDRLTLPHPRAAERGFVLVPWLEIEPHAALLARGRVDQLPAATLDDVRPYPARPLL
ncbi:2-amino-4-hydroxy-6-hydroxymethyldihydropteridine diphosphokinase [Conyzicola nivalis]|uniref:2-amino-4-hydroxy-6-hydroxymethyldihydropteridine diphosphokinase n=2 Tax=Conyzicola nivalis TaxID=1477021 RepID=A0ABV2QSP7_9MICO